MIRKLARMAWLVSITCLAACGGDGASAEPDASAISVSAVNAPASASNATLSPSAQTLAPSRWMPAAADTWQLQLTSTVNTNYPAQVFDIDLVDTPQATINALKAQGKRVVCYFSAGSSENWRPDFKQFAAADMGKALSGWAGERWLDTRSPNVRQIMRARMDLAKSKGCDGVDPDNVDGYANKPGLPLTAVTQLDYNRFLAAEAHARGLAVGLKNDVDQIGQLAAEFDFAVNEQCFQYKECTTYTPFTAQGKAVFNVEYASKYKDAATRATLCASAKAAHLRTLVLPLNLDDAFRYACD